MKKTYEKVLEFKNKFPGSVVWRMAKHAEVVDSYVNPDEEVLYAFCGQKNSEWYDVTSSCVIALTTKRLLIGQKRVLWGSRLNQVTPDMYNDMQVDRGLFYGKIIIDTLKEEIVISNLPKKGLDDIETAISQYMMNAKLQYKTKE